MEEEVIEEGNPDIQDYKNWRGRNKFFCKGRIVTGPGGGELYAVAGAHGLFWLGVFSMSVSIIPYSLSKYNGSTLFTIAAFSGYLIAAWLYYWLVKAQFTDPGVLFREFAYEDDEGGFPSDKKYLKDEEMKALDDKVRQGAHIYKARYCNTCHIMKPPKASHCGLWNNWVQDFDHHCSFINNCVGRRNISAFFGILFLSWTWAIWYVTIGGFYLLHAIFYAWETIRLAAFIPVAAVAFPNLFWVLNFWNIEIKTIFTSLFAAVVLLGSFGYVMPFPEWYINPLAIFFLFVPSVVLMFLNEMTAKYIYLLAHDMTEKEEVSRNRYARQQKIKDEKIKDFPWTTWIANIYKNLTKKNPISLLEVGAKMDQENANDTSDKKIAGMDNNYPKSSSSSSEDELPDFLKPKPMNVVYANDGSVRVVATDGQLVKEIPREEFMRMNPQFQNIAPTQGFTPEGFPNGFPQPQYAPQVFFTPQQTPNPQQTQQNFVANATSPDTMQATAPAQEMGSGEFSEKYKEKIEEERIRKEKETEEEETLDED